MRNAAYGAIMFACITIPPALWGILSVLGRVVHELAYIGGRCG